MPQRPAVPRRGVSWAPTAVPQPPGQDLTKHLQPATHHKKSRAALGEGGQGQHGPPTIRQGHGTKASLRLGSPPAPWLGAWKAKWWASLEWGVGPGLRPACGAASLRCHQQDRVILSCAGSMLALSPRRPLRHLQTCLNYATISPECVK